MSGPAESTLELLKRCLEAETTTEKVMTIPTDFYTKLASYCQHLRQSASPVGDDLSSRLIRKQIALIDGMVDQLLRVRTQKSAVGGTSELLPEEKNVSGLRIEFERRRQRFVAAVINGQPSFFASIRRNEMSKQVTVRFSKPTGEVMGFDLKRYGPFKAHDVAVVPSANAEVFVANGEADVVSDSESF